MTETVERPAAGLGRGRWEAPAWVFDAVAIAALLGVALYVVVLVRSGFGARHARRGRAAHATRARGSPGTNRASRRP